MSPRLAPCVYLPSTLQALDELGLLPDALNIGAVGYEFNMRFKLTGHIGRMDHRDISDLTPYGYTLHFGQHQLAHMVLRHFLALPRAEVRWNTTLDGLEQRPDGVRVRLNTAEGPKSEDFDWVIGADGARSAVRAAMGVNFDGFTWPRPSWRPTSIMILKAADFPSRIW